MKKPFRAGDTVVMLAPPFDEFVVAACYWDKHHKCYRFASHGGGNFACVYFKIRPALTGKGLLKKETR